MEDKDNIRCTLEALILSSPEPVPVQRICEVIGGISARDIRNTVGDLNNIYMGCGNAFRIREIAGGYQMYILPDFEDPVRKLLDRQRAVRLTRAALEALAIIAYKQPVTKSEIEHIRGVSSDAVLHNLLQRDLIVIAGRADSPGRPLLYKTSREFLEFFGLNHLSDQPRMEEIEEMIRQSGPAESQAIVQFTEGHDKDKVISSDAHAAEREAAYETSFDSPVPSDSESVEDFVGGSVDERDSGNGDRGNSDEQKLTILGNFQSIPGDPIPDLEPKENNQPPEVSDKSSRKDSDPDGYPEKPND